MNLYGEHYKYKTTRVRNLIKETLRKILTIQHKEDTNNPPCHQTVGRVHLDLIQGSETF